MAHLARGELPTEDARERVEMFLADAVRGVAEDTSDPEGYWGHCREALRNLRDATLMRVGLPPTPG